MLTETLRVGGKDYQWNVATSPELFDNNSITYIRHILFTLDIVLGLG